jgi:hypothetical protein
VQGVDPLAAVLQRLDEWAETRANKVAAIETVRLNAALTHERWRRGGVRRIVWVALGSKICAFCRRLDGRVVGIDQAFASPGDEIEGADESDRLKVNRKTSHPPIHGGCRCGLRPG